MYDVFCFFILLFYDKTRAAGLHRGLQTSSERLYQFLFKLHNIFAPSTFLPKRHTTHISYYTCYFIVSSYLKFFISVLVYICLNCCIGTVIFFRKVHCSGIPKENCLVKTVSHLDPDTSCLVINAVSIF